MGFGVGLGALVSSEIVNLMTLAAEVGGMALALQLLSGLPYRALIVVGIVALAIVIWVAPFDWIERIFGYCGLALLVFAVGAIKLHPDWGQRRSRLRAEREQLRAVASTRTSRSACSARR